MTQLPYISDHALLRYCERALGVDVEAIRAKLQTPQITKAIAFGAKPVKCEDGRFIIHGGRIVTFYSKDMGMPIYHIGGQQKQNSERSEARARPARSASEEINKEVT